MSLQPRVKYEKIFFYMCIHILCNWLKERKTGRGQKNDYSHLWYHHNERDVLQSPQLWSPAITYCHLSHSQQLLLFELLCGLKWSSIQTRDVLIIQSVCIQQQSLWYRGLFMIAAAAFPACTCLQSATVWGVLLRAREERINAGNFREREGDRDCLSASLNDY